MSNMKISLADNLKHFVDQQVAGRGYGTSSEYVRELIRRDRDRQHLRGLLLEGDSSGVSEAVDASYFDSLRDRALRQSRQVTLRPVVPRRSACEDVENAVEHYLAGPALKSR